MASPALAELSTHLQKVEQDPSLLLDKELLENCELLTSTPEYRSTIWKETQPLFMQLASLLPSLQQDPSPLTHFIIKLAGPYRFEDIKDLDFEIGLDLQATPFHALILSLLEKAAASSTDAQVLANRPGVVSSIVRLWLCTSDTGISTKAEALLISLLHASKNDPLSVPAGETLPMYGNGPMWKRLFNDQDINSLYYHYTSLKPLTSPPAPVLSKRDKTISQARLLSWLPRVGAMDWNSITAPNGIDVEREVGLSEGHGLLHYAALRMVDTDDDILMHMNLVNFFSTLITTVKTRPHLTHYDSSLSLDFVKDNGIHAQIIDSHISDSPSMEQSFLTGRTAQYISDWASTYPDNFEDSPEMPKIRNHVHRNIKKCEASDLNIMASMPRSTLVPRRPNGSLAWNDCLLLDLPVTRTNPDALKTLAAIVHGPAKDPEILTFPAATSQPTPTPTNPQSPHRKNLESTFARLLTSLLLHKKPSLFSDLITHAETLAIKDTALASLSVLHSLLTSTWSSTHPPFSVLGISDSAADPTYTRIHTNFPATALDLLIDPSLSGAVLPTLLKPPTSFSGMVSGARGEEVQNAAWEVARAKFGVLEAMRDALEREEQSGSSSGAGAGPGSSPGRRRPDVLGLVKRRIGQGVWGEGGSAGSRIGTLEL